MKAKKIHIKHGLADIYIPASIVAEVAMAAALGGSLQATPANDSQSIPALGAHWLAQGGINGGLFQGGDRPYYLIVATETLGELKWGAYGETVKGCESPWDGFSNTAALVESEHECPAAQEAAKHSADGHNDFYLPARRELQVLEANVPGVFDKGWHWSSSQRSADCAFTMLFDDGGQGTSGKVSEFFVRPVRRFFI